MSLDDVTPIRFDDQVAIVTGAGGGLGRAYARALAERGARVVVNDLGCARDGTGDAHDSADAVVAEIRAAGGQAVANYDSVATMEGGERIVQAARQAFGRVDILINNAGIIRDKTFPKLTPEMWAEVVAVHLNGAYNVTHPAFLVMREQNYGRIVFTTSSTGLFGNFGQANYGAAKMGLVGLMNCLKLEGERFNLQVNCVAPLAFTRINEEIIPENLQAALKPENVAPLVLYLCARECPVSGGIYNAAMGYFSRTALVTSPVVQVGARGEIPTVEEIQQRWNEIDTIGDQVFNDTVSALFAMTPPEEEAK
jgi:NAD(P)-dependent dehydrogenase (short-subunit alcohol dehydrogenase family)